MRRALSSFNYEIAEADSVNAARAELSRNADLLLLDVNLPGETGLDYLRELHAQKDAPLVVIITAHGNERMTVEAIKGGAYDYLPNRSRLTICALS
jgi:DNA-binding response OmpR family regulator